MKTNKKLADKSSPTELLSDNLAVTMAVALMRGMIAQGVVDPKGLTWAEVVKKCGDAIARATRTGDLAIGTTHIQLLESEARRLRRSFPELAVVLYATIVEHVLNHVLDSLGSRRGLTPMERTELIRAVPLEGKLTWAPKLLGARSVSRELAGKLKHLSDLRNRFLHYKWPSYDVDAERTPGHDYRNGLKNVGPVMRQLRLWQATTLFGGLPLEGDLIVQRMRKAGLMRPEKRRRRVRSK